MTALAVTSAPSAVVCYRISATMTEGSAGAFPKQGNNYFLQVSPHPSKGICLEFAQAESFSFAMPPRIS
jgi:hypothetical protein